MKKTNPKLRIIKKCWRVYDIQLFTHNTYEYDGEFVYADTRGQAKRKCSCESYLDLTAKRYPEKDLVLFENQEVKRSKIPSILKERKILEDIRNLPDDEMYYVQDARSYVGNAVLWWGLNGGGYVCELSKAHKYTKDEIVKQFNPPRDTDKIWFAKHVETATKVIVDAQYLKYEFCI